MKKYCRIAAAVLCAVILSGCGGKGRGAMPAMGEGEEAKAVSVEIANPDVHTVKDEYMYSGTIQASETVDVSAKVQGIVKATYYEVGDQVSAGAVLYKIDDTDYQNGLKSAQAALNSANAGVQSARTSVETANGAAMKTQLEASKNAITSAETNLENSKKSAADAEIAVTNAQTNFDKAKNDYDMNKQLYDVGGLSEDMLNTYRIAYEQAENALTTAQNAKSRAELGIKSAEDALNQAKTSYDILSKETTAENTRRANDGLNSALAAQQSAAVAVDNAKQQIAYCSVTAPISGTVLSKNVTAGAMSAGVGYKIVDLSSLNVEVNVSEQIATSVKVGDTVTINIPSMPSQGEFIGSITEIPPGANPDGTYPVKINIPNTTGELKAGMFAEVYFAKATSNDAVILPRDAVMDNNGEEYYVFVAEGTTARKTPVTVGIDTGDTIEVTSGVTIRDKVVIKGQTYLADGDSLNIVADNGVETVKPAANDAEAPEDSKEAKK